MKQIRNEPVSTENDEDEEEDMGFYDEENDTFSSYDSQDFEDSQLGSFYKNMSQYQIVDLISRNDSFLNEDDSYKEVNRSFDESNNLERIS